MHSDDYYSDDDELYNDADLDDEPQQPDENDWITYDHRTVYDAATGRIIDSMPDPEGDFETWVRELMNREGFWPSVWWVSDHGNCHLIRFQLNDK